MVPSPVPLRLRPAALPSAARPGLRRWRPWLALWVGWWIGALLAVAAAQAQPTAVLRYGVYANEPKIFLDAQGQPAGIFPELLTAIAQREGWRLQPVPCEWQDCLDGLASGRIDLMPDVAYSEARDALFDFHRTPVLHSWSQLYARRGARVEALQDLAGLRVAVLQGSV
ncbi:ABC transporter substrate-binding protein, partial [Aquabacterium sp. A08]|uniref:substrate-binding periplasmic protein n=1 Tax=Aquabacterium sp. A08 TaxID=2718532 RepID=UPI00141ECD55